MDLEEERWWIRETISDACTASMPRVRPSSARAAYWWTEEIADLRRSFVRARRTLDRTRRAQNTPDLAARTREAEAYRNAQLALRKAIHAEKARAWDELLLTLDKDPWGRPYGMVLNRLRGGPPH